MRAKRKTRTLAFQIISFLLIFLVALFAGAIITTRQLVSKVMQRNAEENVGQLAAAKVQMIDKSLSKISTLAINLQILLNDGVYNDSQLSHHINHLLIDNPELISVCLAYGQQTQRGAKLYKLEGSEIKTVVLQGNDFRFKDWYQITRLTGKPYWSDPWYDDQGSRDIVCSFSIPLKLDGLPKGIIRLDTRMENLRRIVLPIKVKKSGYAFLASYNGTIVAHPSDTLAMNYSLFDMAEMDNNVQLRVVSRKIINDETGFIRLKDSRHFDDSWIFYNPLPSNHWSLLIVVPNAEVFTDRSRLMLIYVLTSILAFMIIAAVIWYRTHTINEPLEELVDSIQQAGSGDLQPSPGLTSNTYEIQVLQDSFERMKKSLAGYIENLQVVTEEKNRIIAEVTFASAIQRNLVPSNANPQLLPRNLKAFGILEPAGQVGGDLYDYLLVDEDHFYFAIADVVGKGVGAAMTMTMATTLLRTIAPLYKDPERVLKYLNSFLNDNNLESNFVTMILGFIDLRNGKLVFSNAGHLPLYKLSEQGTVTKYGTTHATALGFFDILSVSSESISLNPGDQLILFTDGITEAVNENDHLFGTIGLEKTIIGLQDSNPEATALVILDAVRKFADPSKHQDDVTILAIEYLGSSGA
jgi:sigma-B regulation protein RsbU (phosphoserine phosphatase)